MWSLGLDTSTPVLSLALCSTEGGLHRVDGRSPLSHNEDILPLFDELCHAAGTVARQLGRVVIGAGPGSFTGLRISYAFSKGLCLALRIPLICISSFRAAAFEFLEPETLICVMADARRNEVFWGSYLSKDGQELLAQSPETILPVAQIEAQAGEELRKSGMRKCVLISPAADILRASLPDSIELLEAKNLGAGLCRLGAAIQSSFCPEALFIEHPNYVRRPAAKTIAERRGGLTLD